MNTNSDLHCHPSLKPTYNPDIWNRNMWEHYKADLESLRELNSLIRPTIRELSRHSQTNLDKCIEKKGNTRVLFFAIYPFEIQFFDIKRTNPFRWFQRILISTKKMPYLAASATGVDIEIAKKKIALVRDEEASINYLDECLDELNTLTLPINKNRKIDDKDHYFHLAKNSADYKRLVGKPNNIVGIVTVEGAHSFATYPIKILIDIEKKKKRNALKLSYWEEDALEKSFKDGIKKVKNQSDTSKIPFFVTFCHHFNNHLAGHATSLSDKSPVSKFTGGFPFQPGMRHFFNQESMLEEGFRPLGKRVLDMLLSKDSKFGGRRILIDTKHMSVKSRIDFYKILKEHYNNDNIPVINSHTAVNGWKTLEEIKDQKPNWKTDKGSFFSRWGINMTDEDIQETFLSDGIIGVCLHEGRMPGEKFKKIKKPYEKKLRELKKKEEKNDLTQRQKRKKRELIQKVTPLFTNLLWSNIIHIVKIQKQVINDSNDENFKGRCPWEGIAIGSDYDGIVNAFDNVEEVDDYNKLREDLVEHINKKREILNVHTEKPIPPEEILNLINLNNKNLEYRINQIMIGNVENFLLKYFNDEYLNG